MEKEKPVRPRFYYVSHAALFVFYIMVAVSVELFLRYVWPKLDFLSTVGLAPLFYFLTYDFIYRDYKAKLENYKAYIAREKDEEMSTRKAAQLKKEQISNLRIAKNIESYKLKLDLARNIKPWWKFWS